MAEDGNALANALASYDTSSQEWTDLKKRLYLDILKYLEVFGEDGKVMFAIFVDRILSDCELSRKVVTLQLLGKRFGLCKTQMSNIQNKLTKDLGFRQIVTEIIGEVQQSVAA